MRRLGSVPSNEVAKTPMGVFKDPPLEIDEFAVFVVGDRVAQAASHARRP